VGEALKHGKAIALMNRGEAEVNFKLKGISKNSKLRDLWAHKDLRKSARTFTIPKHGVIVLKVD
jgi:hypothetical protein